jgi:hypothetical protein
MGIEPLGAGERHGRRAKRLQAIGIELEKRGALHKVQHTEAGSKAGAARGRQHVIGAGDVIADHLRRIAPDEDGAGIVYARGECIGVFGGDLQMLGRKAIGQGRRLVEARDLDHGAKIVPARLRGLGTRQRGQLRFDRLDHVAGEVRIVGDEDRLCRGVMLGLGQQIGGDPGGIVVAVGDDHWRLAAAT